MEATVKYFLIGARGRHSNSGRAMFVLSAGLFRTGAVNVFGPFFT
jgi:hypothetical protein